MTGLPAAVSDLLAGEGITHTGRVTELTTSPRSRVWRVDVVSARPSVVAKSFFPGPGLPDRRGCLGDELFANEESALRLFERIGLVPRVMAGDPEARVLLLEDLGTAPSISTLLSDPKSSPDHLLALLCSWARALAALHVESQERLVEYEQARMQRDAPKAHGHPVCSVIPASVVLGGLCSGVGISWDPVRAADDLTRAVVSVSDYRGIAIVDVCPDNVLATDAGVRMLDFELAHPTHLLIDAASLAIPFPNCRCGLSLPEEVTADVLEAYRTVLAERVPAARDAASFARELRRCRTVWDLTVLARFLTGALAADSNRIDAGVNEIAARSLAARRRIGAALTRIGSDPAADEIVAAFVPGACALLGELRQRWPDGAFSTTHYPAFA